LSKAKESFENMEQLYEDLTVRVATRGGDAQGKNVATRGGDTQGKNVAARGGDTQGKNVAPRGVDASVKLVKSSKRGSHDGEYC
jgi:hypothetical protein